MNDQQFKAAVEALADAVDDLTGALLLAKSTPGVGIDQLAAPIDKVREATARARDAVAKI